MPESTLIVIKPDAVSRGLIGDIIQRFELKGFGITKLKMFNFTVSQAKIFYRAHSDKPFFGELVSFITSGPVVAAMIRGNNAVATTRMMIGSTKSYEAAPGTIRGDMGLGLSDNIIHASDSRDSFKHESAVVFA